MPAATAPPPDPFAPATLGPITLRNRFVKAATFEGMAPGGQVTDALIAHHRAVADGGVGVTTLAYCAVSPDGQGAPHEIVVDAGALAGLRRFTEAIHATGAAASIQLGHAGPVAAGAGRRGMGPSRRFSPQAMRFTHAASVEDLERVIHDFGTAAGVAVEAGFDAVELHFGHGYLPSAFLSPRLNRRRDAWGGSLENRARLARRIARTVHERVRGRLAVLAKLNMRDGVPGGLELDDAVAVARLLETDATVDALALTGGSSLQNPMFLFRGEPPIAELSASLPRALRLAFRLTARRFLKHYPFEEAFFLADARRVRAAVRLPLVLLGGVNRMATVRQAMAEGFDFVAMGRALLREPDLVARWRRGDEEDARCTHCNRCVPTIYRGTHCVLVPPAERPGHGTAPPGGRPGHGAAPPQPSNLDRPRTLC